LIKLCDYGCGKESKYIMNNGKVCCEPFYYRCAEYRRKIGEESKRRIREPRSKETKRKISEKLKGISSGPRSLECRLKISEKLKGKKKPPRTLEHSLNQSNSQFGKKRGPVSQETRIKISIANTGKKQSENHKKIQRERMIKNGSYIRKFIKKISRPELNLRKLVQEIYSDCSFQYKVLNYEVDVALPDTKIAIEYDGYYHFDTEEHKQYHKQRQEKIEKEGWKFLRYTMFDKFPTLEKLKEDLSKIEV
jgi:very-short-patch-repair endonuclease